MEAAQKLIEKWSDECEFGSFLEVDEDAFQMTFQTSYEDKGPYIFQILFEQSWTPMVWEILSQNSKSQFVMSDDEAFSLWVQRINTFIQRQSVLTLPKLLAEFDTSLRVFYKVCYCSFPACFTYGSMTIT